MKQESFKRNEQGEIEVNPLAEVKDIISDTTKQLNKLDEIKKDMVRIVAAIGDLQKSEKEREYEIRNMKYDIRSLQEYNDEKEEQKAERIKLFKEMAKVLGAIVVIVLAYVGFISIVLQIAR